MNIEDIKRYLEEGSNIRNSLDMNKIMNLGIELLKCFNNGNKLILFGNGGSAADAQHIAAEFVGKFEHERRSLPAMVLHGNTSTITAIGNDYSFDEIYARQISAFCNKGDTIIALSTSGNSVNILKGIDEANLKQANVFGITGQTGGKMIDLIYEDRLIRIPSKRTSYIQESTIAIGHIISKIIEDSL